MHLAKLEGSVDHRVEHGVGQSNEGETQEDDGVDDSLQECYIDEDYVVWRPAHDKSQNDDEGHSHGLPFGLPQEMAAHRPT